MRLLFTTLLFALSTLLVVAGYFSSRLPWGLIWEWTFRLLGAAAFGARWYFAGAWRSEHTNFCCGRSFSNPGQRSVVQISGGFQKQQFYLRLRLR